MIKIQPCSYDIIFQSTVFTSILDDELKIKIAENMWEWLKPGGFILWYDFIYNNPKNPDVKGIKIDEIRSLFPHGKVEYKKVTLAPPINRFVTQIDPLFYNVFNILTFIRTHVLCHIEKIKD